MGPAGGCELGKSTKMERWVFCLGRGILLTERGSICKRFKGMIAIVEIK